MTTRTTTTATIARVRFGSRYLVLTSPSSWPTGATRHVARIPHAGQASEARNQDASAARVGGREHVSGRELLAAGHRTGEAVVLGVGARAGHRCPGAMPRRSQDPQPARIAFREPRGRQVPRQLGHGGRAPVPIGGAHPVTELGQLEPFIVGLVEGALEMGTTKAQQLADSEVERLADAAGSSPSSESLGGHRRWPRSRTRAPAVDRGIEVRPKCLGERSTSSTRRNRVVRSGR